MQEKKDDDNKFEFVPRVLYFNETIIKISYDFMNKKKLSLSNQAKFIVGIKEPSLLRTKLTL